MNNQQKIRVLFVCLGNICRSPTAHGVFEKMVAEAGLENYVDVDSCGTAGYHVGEKPDQRSAQAALARGYPLNHLRARQFQSADFDNFDYILTMDRNNLSDITHLKPQTYSGTLDLLLSFGEGLSYKEVPDPYYGGDQGFQLVLDLIEDASRNLLSEIKQKL